MIYQKISQNQEVKTSYGMKKIITILTIGLALTFYVPALALVGGVDIKSNSGDEVKIDASVKASSSENEENDNEKDSTSTEREDAEVHGTSSASKTGEEHRSAVATFVQGLLSIANREPGIGSQVRVIAEEQNDSASTTADAIVKVENRDKLSTFLFGTDYKNTGVIRSELAKTENRIEKLQALASSTVSVSDKVQIEADITALKAEQVKLDAFVMAHESEFSLFGWFVKIFAK